MKIAIFGASGKIGSKVTDLLSTTHQIVTIGSRSGDLQADYMDDTSVKAIFDSIENLDAVIACVGGDSQFKHYSEVSDDDYRFGAERKLVAQFRIVKYAEQYLNDNGSIAPARLEIKCGKSSSCG
jgi:putative NADH-flavin reductase